MQALQRTRAGATKERRYKGRVKAIKRTSAGATKDECRRYIFEDELQALQMTISGALQRTIASTTKDECRRSKG